MIPEDLCDRDCDWPHYCPCEEFEQLRDSGDVVIDRDMGNEDDNTEGEFADSRNQADGQYK